MLKLLSYNVGIANHSQLQYLCFMTAFSQPNALRALLPDHDPSHRTGTDREDLR